MSVTIQFILSLSIVFSVVLGIVRYRRVDKSYYPFIYYISVMLAVELIVFGLNEMRAFTAILVMFNMYTLFEFALLAWLFHAWGLFNRNKTFFIALLAGFGLAWLIITVISNSITTDHNFYFRVLYSFALVLFSVSAFNKMVVNHRGSIFQNAQFWICLGIIIFFTFFLLDNATKLSLVRHTISNVFKQNLQKIIVFSNLLVNILYVVAVIWIPRKKNFMTSF